MRRGTNIHWQPLLIGKAERAALKHQKPAILWFTGLSGAGKSTIANIVEQRLHGAGHHTMLLDGDNVRHGLNRDLGFTEADRVENIRRAGEVAKLMVEAGLIVLCSFISPYRAERDMVRGLVGPDEFIEVFVDTPIEDCMQRDPKGLYAKAKAGKLKNFTGVDAPYQAPERPEIHLHTIGRRAEDLAAQVLDALVERSHHHIDLTPHLSQQQLGQILRLINHHVVAARHRVRLPFGVVFDALVELVEHVHVVACRQYVGPMRNGRLLAGEANALGEGQQRLRHARLVDPGGVLRIDVERGRRDRREQAIGSISPGRGIG